MLYSGNLLIQLTIQGIDKGILIGLLVSGTKNQIAEIMKLITFCVDSTIKLAIINE